MLIAEELVLLALDPDGTLARGAATQPYVALGVTGALVAELALDGHLDLADGRIRLTGTPSHPMLVRAFDNVAPHEGKKLTSRLASITHAGWNEVVDGMVDAGVVGREKHGLRSTRHPVADREGHAALLAEVRSAATGDEPLDARTATLLALAGPCQMLEVVAPARADRQAAERRIAEAADQVPTAPAVKAAVDAVTATIIAGAAVGAAGATAS